MFRRHEAKTEAEEAVNAMNRRVWRPLALEFRRVEEMFPQRLAEWVRYLELRALFTAA